jgi:hypothetical protein
MTSPSCLFVIFSSLKVFVQRDEATTDTEKTFVSLTLCYFVMILLDQARKFNSKLAGEKTQISAD